MSTRHCLAIQGQVRGLADDIVVCFSGTIKTVWRAIRKVGNVCTKNMIASLEIMGAARITT